jgi:uncharacterized FAD-dependent dehydrogenase
MRIASIIREMVITMEAVRTSNSSIYIEETIQRYIRKGCNVHTGKVVSHNAENSRIVQAGGSRVTWDTRNFRHKSKQVRIL